MRILAFADLHGEMKAFHRLKKKSKQAELIICAGDITIFENHIHKIVDELSKLGKPLLIIHGNHESEQRLGYECSKHKNTHYIHKSFYNEGELVFAGYGGGGFALRDERFEHFSKKIVSKAKNKKLILITHGPPYGNKTDLISDEHAGNKSYSEFIKKHKPMLVICGHLHENNGVKDKLGNSIIINPGPEGKIINI